MNLLVPGNAITAAGDLMRNTCMKILPGIFFVLGTVSAYAQSSANYTFATHATGSLGSDINSNAVDMSNGTTQLIGGGFNDVASPVTGLPFEFWLMGNRYTQFSVSSNGIIQLGSTAVTSTVYAVSGGTVTRPKISAFAADGATAVGNKIHYKVIGTAPNRTLVIEFRMNLYQTAGNPLDGIYQVRLYENTGVIEFIYGAMSISSLVGTADGSVGIGFSNSTTDNSFVYVTTATHTATTITPFTDNPFYPVGPITDLNSAAEGSRRVYRFTPGIPLAPTGLTFSAVGAGGMTLNWTDNATNEFGYAIYRSLDGINYSYISQTGANVASSAQGGLSPSTLYYWKVYAITEGAISSELPGSQSTNGCTLTGTYDVGPGAASGYTSLKAAVDAVLLNGVTGPVILELNAAYLGTTDIVFPIVLSAVPCASSINNITIRPAAGAGAKTISGSSTTAILDINGGNYWTIDGRQGGAGTSKSLTFANTNTSGAAIRYINEASNNIVKYVIATGVNNSAANGGVVLFSTTTGTNGNDNNTIDNCDIKDGATTAANGIFSSGTTTLAAQNNSGNTISNNNIFNFYVNTNTTVAVGVLIGNGNTDWTITGNSLYQTVARTFTATTSGYIGISINNATGNNFTVNNNFIGGTAPSAGGTAWTQNGAVTHSFIGIRMSVGTAMASNVQGNTIKNIAMTTSSTSSISAGISAVTGSINVGNTAANTIGDQSSTGSITWTGAGNGQLTGILAGTGTAGVINISNNTIGGITVAGTGTTVFRGINTQGTATSYTISGNTIGSTTTANSISSSVNSTVAGILSSSLSNSVTISGNTIANLATTNTNTGNQLLGISTSAGVNTITGNTVRNLSSTSTSILTGLSASVIGISQLSPTAGQTLSQNIIHTLSNTTPTVAGQVTGIYYAGPITGTNLIARNFVHSLSLSSTSAAATITGIAVAAGASTYQNNMVRLGIDATGVSLINPTIISGINKSTGNNNNFYHNSIYIGGTGVASGTTNTVAFRRTAAGTDDIRNNIFFNARSNAAGTGKHYNIGLDATTTALVNQNVYYGSGTGFVHGYIGTTDYTAFTLWRSGTGLDASGAFGDPQFVAPAANSAAVDLHLHPTNPTPAESNGILIASVTDDYDGLTRTGLTPVDIGADAGGFVLSDIAAPSITYTALSVNTCGTGDRILSGVNITDASGVPTSGSLMPRIYYRKNSGAYFSRPGTLSSGTGLNGQWDFTIVAADMGSLVVGDVVQYYVIAQDIVATPNISSDPGGVMATDVNTITTAPPSPNAYTIKLTLSGTYLIGAGQIAPNYTTLTAAVADYNTGCVSGPVIFELQDANYSAAETFPITINTNATASSVNTLTIKPKSGLSTTVTGSATALIRLSGADHVIIDGSNNGSGSRDMSIVNTTAATATAVIWLSSASASDGATNNVIKNCIINGNSSTTTGYGILSGGTSIPSVALAANSNNIIQNNFLEKVQTGIYIQGTSTASPDINNQVISNNLGSAVSGDGFSVHGIVAQFQDGTRINGNDVQNIVNSGNTNADHYGIAILDVKNAVVDKNKVHFMTYSGTGSDKLFGIITQTATFNTIGNPSNNLISNNVVYNIISSAGSGNWSISGIDDEGGYNDKFYFNSVYLTGSLSGTATATAACFANGNGVTGSACNVIDVRNNVFFMNGSSDFQVYLYAHFSTATSNTGFTLNYNDLIANVSGSAIDNIGRFNSADYNSLLAWQTDAGEGLNSISADPLFASPVILRPGLGSPLVGNGVAGTGVLTDILNITRSGGTAPAGPTIGAYEQAGDFSGPVIMYTAFDNTLCTDNRALSSVTITDVSDVNITAGTRPRLYYKKSTNDNGLGATNDNTTDGWKYVEATGTTASPFSFIIDYTLLNGGIALGDVIQYFVVAQDLSGTANVSINSGTFATTQSSVALTAAAFPIGSTINSYILLTTGKGTDVTIGSGGDYPTLTGAGGLFEALNNGGLIANINAKIISTTITEPGTVALNSIRYGCAGPYTLTIKPDAGVTAVLTGSSARAIIKLNGADHVIINGSNNGSSSSDMTITNTNAGIFSAVVWLASTATGDSATNNTIKNCIITGSDPRAGTLGGIISSGSEIAKVAEAPNSNNTYHNNTISRSLNGILLAGPSILENGNVITQNTIGTSANAIGFRGIHIANEIGTVITGNTVQHLVTTSTMQAAGGIALLGTTSGVNISNNTLKNITSSAASSGTSSVMAIYIGTSSNNTTVNANTITGISNTNSSGYGVRAIIVMGHNATISNNSISDVYNYQDQGSAYWPIGIDIDGASSGINVYYNSVNLFGSHRGYALNTSEGSAAALFINSFGGTFDIRNNVFGNAYENSSSSGDKSYAIYNTGNASQFSHINYNDYFAPAPAGVLGSLNGVDVTTLAAWQAATGDDVNSIVANPFYVTTTILKPNTGSAVVGFGSTGTGILTDIVNVTRSTGTAPSGPTMGAYEQAGDFIGPIITYTNLNNALCVVNRTLTPVTITDVNGVNITAGTRPRLYYKKTTNANTLGATNDNTTNGWKYVEATGSGGSPFDFTTVNANIFGGVAAGDIIQYFVVAQDNAPIPNVGINSGTFAVTPSTVALTAAAFPLTGTVNQYTISTPLAADVTIGSSGTYPTLTGAGGLFDAINKSGLAANINARIISTPITEPGTFALNTIVYDCAGGPYSLTIKPDAGIAAVLTGSNSAGAIIKLNGADMVTIDGVNIGGSSMSITNTSTSLEAVVVWIGSAGAGDGATHNTIKNCSITGATSVTTPVGIIAGSGLILGGTAEAPNSNNTIQGNTIRKCGNGIYVSGFPGTLDLDWIINNNAIGSAVGGDKITFRGLFIGNVQNMTVNDNTITGIASPPNSISTVTGIHVALSINGGAIFNNKISDIKHTSNKGWGSNGIFLASSSKTSDLNVYNNVIYDVASYGFNDVNSTDNSYGIMVETGGGYKIRFNSIRLTSNQTDASGITAAINVSDGIAIAGGSLEIRDNIFANTQTTGNRYAIHSRAANTVYSNINYNDYFAAGASGVLGSLNGVNLNTLAAWKAATGQDANSIAGDPLFTSATDLSLQTGSPALSAGVTIAGITTDITGATRSNPPAMGAYENKVVVSLKIFLQGAYNAALGRHKDVTATWAAVLNANALAQPYGAIYGYTGIETVSPAFFVSTGASTDILDWVLIELRDATTPATIIARRAAFIREDGMIVDIDGSSAVSFGGVAPGNYFISIRHRNHLAIRTATAQAVDGNSATPTTYDFSSAQAFAYQDQVVIAMPSPNNNTAMKDLGGGKFGMWGGNANSDTQVKFTGLNNDAGVIISALGGQQGNVLNPVYNRSDLNLDGAVRYTGLNNDSGILISVLLAIQSAIYTQHL